MSEYSKKFKDPRWQKRRLEVLEKYGFECVNCGDDQNTLHVHHTHYIKGRNPWEYSDDELIVFCDKCHKAWHDAKRIIDEAVGGIHIAEDLIRIAGYAMAMNDGPSEKWLSDDRTKKIGFSDFFRTTPDVIDYCAKKDGFLPTEISRQTVR